MVGSYLEVHFNVLVVIVCTLLVTQPKRVSFNCSLIISFQLSTCPMPLAVCIHVKHIKFYLTSVRSPPRLNQLAHPTCIKV